MKQVLIRQGRVVVEQMPVPDCGPGEVLVRTAYSLISSGTESAHVRGTATSESTTRWLERSKKAGEVLRMAARRGLTETREAVSARLEGPSHVSGYSLSGTVMQVGRDVRDLVPGQSVACAGASSAHHAEIVSVPRNLVAPVPAGMPLDQAAAVTLGAIALHGVRQTDVRLGEFVCVLGLGLVGQLTVALLRASGCRVIGMDPDASRLARARSIGLELAAGATEIETAVDHLTGGHGVDAVVVTAGTSSSEPVRQAVRLVRRRGRIVVVGDVGMEIDRNALYLKEAEFRISCSYGPGRYDPEYEERGQDYPYGYVRWTENRNMQEFLRLGASGRLALDRLVDRRYPIEQAADAYAVLTGDSPDRPLGLLLCYGSAEAAPATDGSDPRRIEIVRRRAEESGVGVGLVGPGEFARRVLLPRLAGLSPAASLRAVVSRSANGAREAARRFGAAYASTDLDVILRDTEVRLVLIATRHDQHAEQATRALLSGKAVFLEKPAAIDAAGLDTLDNAVVRSGCPFTVGFNRRFAPSVLALASHLAGRRGPLVVNYRVNAGKLQNDHWALGPQGGGRLIGEACHMIDLLRHLVGRSRISHSLATAAPAAGRADLPIGDNFVLTSTHDDGSVTTLVYTSLGHATCGKERIECHWDGRTAVIDDFRGLTLDGVEDGETRSGEPDKGHGELLRRFVEHVDGRATEPIPWAEILEVSRFVLELDRQARGAPPADRG